jgi:hypothetical protein
MSIDRRLREAFQRSRGRPSEPIDVERHLRTAVARARPRELARVVATVTVTLGVVGGAFAAGVAFEGARNAPQPLDGRPAPADGSAVAPAAGAARRTALDGIYGTTIRVADGRAAGLTSVDAFGVSGAMQVWFSRDTVRIEQALGTIHQVPVMGTIEVSGHRVVIHDGGDTLALDWHRRPDGDLRFTIVDDTRSGGDRVADEVLWTSHPWALLSR